MAASTNTQKTSFSWYSLRLGVDPLFSPLPSLFKDADCKDKVLMTIFFTLSIVSLFVLQIFFYHSINEGEDFDCALFVTYGSSLISYDLILFTLSFIIWMGFDRIKYGFSLWSYLLFIFFSIFAAIAIVAPFYFGLRVSRQAHLSGTSSKNSNESNIPKMPVAQHSENPTSGNNDGNGNNANNGNGKTDDNYTKSSNGDYKQGCGFCCQSMILPIIFVFLMFWFMMAPTPVSKPGLCDESD